MLVSEDLDLDVTRVLDELLDEDAIVAEGRFRLRARAGEAFRHLVGPGGDAHPLAAAAGRRLDHHRIADRVGDLHGLLGVLDRFQMAGDGRHAGLGGELLRGDLVAHRLDGARIGTDEDDARRRQRRGESRTFRQKPVSRMHRLGAGLAAGRDDLGDVEIGLRGGRWADQHGFVGHGDVQPRRDRPRNRPRRWRCPCGARGLDDPTSDLASVGDEDFREHGPRLLVASRYAHKRHPSRSAVMRAAGKATLAQDRSLGRPVCIAACSDDESAQTQYNGAWASEIASNISGVSKSTVESHQKSIFPKTGAGRRASLSSGRPVLPAVQGVG